MTQSTRPEYVFANAGREAAPRFSALASVFDPGTIRHLQERGVAEGWSCLEIGAGGGSIALWLCERVGATGKVLATDIDPRFLETLRHAALEVRRHDVVVDPLPEQAFDLVHTRLVLGHLPEREKVLHRMVAALRPGGWVVVEEFDTHAMVAEPDVYPDETALPAIDAMRRVMAARGVDARFGRSLASRLRGHGLADVDAEGRVFLWRGGSPGAVLLKAGLEQLREAAIAAGEVGAAEIDADLQRLDDPRCVAPSPVLWAAWGRRV
jgi:SAM-dependent methyltransferase